MQLQEGVIKRGLLSTFFGYRTAARIDDFSDSSTYVSAKQMSSDVHNRSLHDHVLRRAMSFGRDMSTPEKMRDAIEKCCEDAGSPELAEDVYRYSRFLSIQDINDRIPHHSKEDGIDTELSGQDDESDVEFHSRLKMQSYYDQRERFSGELKYCLGNIEDAEDKVLRNDNLLGRITFQYHSALMQLDEVRKFEESQIAYIHETMDRLDEETEERLAWIEDYYSLPKDERPPLWSTEGLEL